VISPLRRVIFGEPCPRLADYKSRSAPAARRYWRDCGLDPDAAMTRSTLKRLPPARPGPVTTSRSVVAKSWWTRPAIVSPSNPWASRWSSPAGSLALANPISTALNVPNQPCGRIFQRNVRCEGHLRHLTEHVPTKSRRVGCTTVGPPFSLHSIVNRCSPAPSPSTRSRRSLSRSKGHCIWPHWWQAPAAPCRSSAPPPHYP
jgi:hypothetical protein